MKPISPSRGSRSTLPPRSRKAAERLAGARYDAVIADVCLTPQLGSEGLAIAAYLRHLKTDPPVVVLTAYGLPDRAEGRGAPRRRRLPAQAREPRVAGDAAARPDRRPPSAAAQPMAAAG
jgi:CheY-like chemotaxis protein